MRDLGIQLPPRERERRMSARTREMFFFVVSFCATFLAAMLILRVFL